MFPPSLKIFAHQPPIPVAGDKHSRYNLLILSVTWRIVNSENKIGIFTHGLITRIRKKTIKSVSQMLLILQLLFYYRMATAKMIHCDFLT
jgi:hypothetical protein